MKMKEQLFNNDNLKQILAREPNVILLEEILSEEYEKLRELKSRGNFRNKGNRIKTGHTHQIFQEVKQDVDKLFEIDSTDPIQIITDDRPVGGYLNGVIYLPSNNREAPLRKTIAHEYTHHLTNQQLVGNFKKLYSTHGIYLEGLATAASAHFGSMWSERHQNNYYINQSLNFYYLRKTYELLCEQLSIQPMKLLKKIPKGASIIKRWMSNKVCEWLGTKEEYYYLGYSLIKIIEMKNGNSIYPMLIKGKSEVLEGETRRIIY